MAETTDKIIVVTGASGEIGGHIVGHLARIGYKVVGLSRTKPINAVEGSVHIPTDICNEASIDESLEIINSLPGTVYGLVNTAGSLTSMHAMVMPTKSISEMIQTNVFGTLLVTRAMAKLMLPQRTGRIVFFGSMASILCPPGDAVYSATKHATIGMADSLGVELAPLGITCNSIIVTATEKGMSEKVNKAKLKEVINSLPTGSWTTIPEILFALDFFSAKQALA